MRLKRQQSTVNSQQSTSPDGAAGIDMTPQRETILSVFQNLRQGNHLSAEQLYKNLQNQGEKIGLSTVYRTLHLLARIGILRELELAEGHKHYELNWPELHHHHHLVCIQCHKTFEFNDESIFKIGKKQVEKAGVELLDCQLTVHAVCLEALREGWPSLIPSNWLCPQYHSEIEGEILDGAVSTVPALRNQATSESQR